MFIIKIFFFQKISKFRIQIKIFKNIIFIYLY